MSSKFKNILNDYASTLSESAGVRKRTVGCEPLDGALTIPVNRLVPDENQPRQDPDEEELYHLAGSLKARGQIQPLLVRYDTDRDIYVIIAGERRWRAAQIAQLETLSCVVDSEDKDGEALLHLQLAENLVRAELNPLDAAKAYKALMDKKGWTGKQLAEALNVSEAKVSRTLAILKLPEPDQAKVATGEVSPKRAVKKTIKPQRKRGPRSVTIKTALGQVVVTPKAGVEVDAVLQAALERPHSKAA